MSDTTTLERRDADLRVIAEFSNADTDVYPVGPQRLVIETTEKGIDSAILRRADRRLGEMVAEFNEILGVGGFRSMVVQYTEDRLAALPSDGDAFHRGLLDLYDDLAGRERVDPDRTLAAALRVPEETLRACLQVARQQSL
ncbi:hypothetical protein OHA21_27125 [Actinoplanes sp. NBC_00393]|uniref:hypothetical protein n=1 Tax=Actinoplanes sp. NBC_00393 TaxID=2975953 RepID=UPI002E23FAB2